MTIKQTKTATANAKQPMTPTHAKTEKTKTIQNYEYKGEGQTQKRFEQNQRPNRTEWTDRREARLLRQSRGLYINFASGRSTEHRAQHGVRNRLLWIIAAGACGSSSLLLLSLRYKFTLAYSPSGWDTMGYVKNLSNVAGTVLAYILKDGRWQCRSILGQRQFNKDSRYWMDRRWFRKSESACMVLSIEHNVISLW